MKKFVVMSGGFHPFHAGHASLYQQAKEAFPDAKVLVCATNVQSDRPFPFSLKKKLAQLSGVPPKDFIEVSRQFTIQDPALAQRIGNPDDAIVIYVRSDKDRNEAPQPWKLGPDGKPPVGKKGPKKGLPLSNYLLEYLGEGQPLEPVSKHAYMAYLKTVEFGPGITSASEIRNAWPKLNEKRKLVMVMSLYPTTKSNPQLAQNVVGMFDQVMGEQQGVAEGSKKKKKKASRSLGRYFFPGYSYYGGGGESSEGGGDGGGEGVNEFAPPGSDDREPDEEEILRQLAAQWWNGSMQQMKKAQQTLQAMGWDIGQDESGDDDAGVFVIRIGDENGDSYIAFNHSDLDLNEDYLNEK